MALIEGKTPTERNKMIAAAVLGLIALIALYLAFGRSFFGGSTTTASTKSSPTPRPSATPGANPDKFKLPTSEEQAFIDQTTVPVIYNPGNSFAPDPGRNIFAFYEPPPPTPYVATPVPEVSVKPPTPTPTPIFLATYINPPSVYAGSRGFRLEVNGERFTPDARIYFNQNEIPTTFINGQKLVSDIPANFITQEGPRQVIVQTPDGKAYSTQLILNVQAPPRPAFQYIGMIGRKRYNNDTAYFLETGKTTPFGARLNDVVGGRFRLVDISAIEVIFEDVNLGFRHRVSLTKATTAGGQPFQPGRNDGGFNPNNPNIPADCPPGIPCNIPRQQPQKTPNKDDVDDNDDGDGGSQ